MKLLDQVLAQQEPAHDKTRAGADESFDVRSISFVQRHGNWLLHRIFPFPFEIFPPCRELAESANVVQHYIEFPVVRWRELGYQDPCEEV